MEYDVIIIGGGASGLVAAIAAARRGRSVLIIEQKERTGKKILATGNGKCNYTNRVQTIDCYRGNHPEFAWNLMKHFGFEETITFFSDLGILPKEKNGYFYPHSEQAVSIAEVLFLEAKRLKVQIHCKERVIKIEKRKQNFFIDTQCQIETEEKINRKTDTKINLKDKNAKQKLKKGSNIGNIQIEQRQYSSKKIILAAGGMAAKIHGSDGSGLELAKKLGHTIITPLPALTQLKALEPFVKTLAGVRAEARGTLYINGEKYKKEQGEFLFTDYGISGIPIFQISRFAAEAILKKKKTELYLDFLPEFDENKAIEFITWRYQQNRGKTAEEAMIGLFNHKLSFVLLKECNIQLESNSETIPIHQLKKLAHLIKQFKLTIFDTNGFEQAQVMAGGIDTTEISGDILESFLVKGLYFAGEIIDIDGTCGGYNLQWAWTSGFLAGSQI